MAKVGRIRIGTRRQARPTIAVLLDYMVLHEDGFEAELRNNLDAHCKALDLNLLLVYGRAFEDPAGIAHNAVFDLIHRDRVDGLIVVSTTLSTHCGAQGMLRFCQRYAAMPICSVGIALAGIPSVVLENRPGMTAVVEHIVTEHDCRRVAFITGPLENPEAKLRFDVYRELLAEHGIETDEALVAHGNFMKIGGRAAMAAILDRGVHFDAVIASNDTMAIGAIVALRERGYHVPGDIPVTGFDDLLLSRLSNPALTTVTQPFSAMTQAALQIVLEQLAGNRVPETLAMACELVVRRSCGCNPLIYGAGYGPIEDPVGTPSGWLGEHSARIRITLARSLSRDDEDGLREADQLLAALDQALFGRPEAFYAMLEAMLESVGGSNERYRALHDAITSLRHEFRSVTTVALEALFCDAVSLIAMANTTAQSEHRLRIDDEYVRLLSVGERSSLALDLPALQQELHYSLPLAGFATVFVSHLSTASNAFLEPLVALVDGQAMTPLETQFPAQRFVPDSVFPADRRITLVVFPLVFETQILGVAAFGYVPNVTGYVMIRDQISATLRSVLLHQEVLSKTMLHQRSVQEKQAAAQRLLALSVLAGGVAHDLNNALGPLVALPDLMQQELQSFKDRYGTAPGLAEDIASIRSAAMRATQTIKDLLTLGRQGKTARQAIDLNRVVGDCLSGDFMRFLKELRPNVRIVSNIAPETLVVRASEIQLARAITNLVRNAVEALATAGEVSVRLFFERLTEPLKCRETIEPGDYAVIAVTDTGSGIPEEHLEHIFEPFFSSKRTGEQSGTGLGLSIVLGVVKEHDGFINVTSTVGRGTEFTLYLPTVEDVPRRSDRVTLTRPREAKILIVDDDPAQLRTGRRVLTSLGYSVETMDSGRMAYAAFAATTSIGKAPYDLVILDMMLRDDWDGLQVFEQIRKLYPNQAAIIASGHAPSERLETALEHGLAWLAKPYTVQSLTRAVAEALDQL